MHSLLDGNKFLICSPIARSSWTISMTTFFYFSSLTYPNIFVHSGYVHGLDFNNVIFTYALCIFIYNLGHWAMDWLGNKQNRHKAHLQIASLHIPFENSASIMFYIWILIIAIQLLNIREIASQKWWLALRTESSLFSTEATVRVGEDRTSCSKCPNKGVHI